MSKDPVHMRQRGKSWVAIVELPRALDGKRRQKWLTAATKRQARDAALKALAEVRAGTYIEPSKQTVGQYLDSWLTDYVAVKLRPQTARGYRTIVDRHLRPRLGVIRLADVTAQHIQRAEAALREGGMGEATLRNVHRVLVTALGRAVKLGILARNPAALLEPPRPRRPEMRALTPMEAERLLAAAEGSDLRPLIHLGLHSGLRRGELLGLRWGDFDPLLGTLAVNRSLQVVRRQVIFTAPKSASSRRPVPLGPTALIALRHYRELCEYKDARIDRELSPEAPIFARIDGSPMLPDTVSHEFRRIADRAGLPWAHVHTLRHTHATAGLSAGIHPLVMSKRLGHSTIAVTLDLYSHVTPALQHEAAESIERALAVR